MTGRPEGAPSLPRLRARSRRVDGDVDLLALAGRDGLLFERGAAGLAGRGEALRLTWPAGDPAAAALAVAAALVGIETDDEVGQPGCGPVAFGALPFRPGAACELIVPRVVVGRAEDGTRWVTTIESVDGSAERHTDVRQASGSDHLGAPPTPAAADDDPGAPRTRAAADAGDRGTTGDPSTHLLDDVAAGRLTAEHGDELLARLTRGAQAGGAGGADRAGGAGGGELLPLPRRYTVEASVGPDEWCALVERATKLLADRPASLASGILPDPAASTGAGGGTAQMAKVVLAREVVVTADRPLDRLAVLTRLRAAYPGCHLISVDGLVGASPELLVSRHGDVVRSHPMAGTAPRGGDPTTDQRLAASLLASAKDRAEHQITIDMVHDTLLGWCSYLDYEAEPSVVAVANVQHLATLVEGRLSRPAPSVLELVAALHPTPAVAGWPRHEAVEWIVAHEGFDRGRYAGTVGWADARGNGTWAVSVRCAEVEGTMARVFAGNGVVSDSDPQAELAETQAKLQALLSAIVRP